MTTPPIKNHFKKEMLTADSLFILCLALFPVLMLSLQRWISVFLFVAFGVALYILARDGKRQVAKNGGEIPSAWFFALLITLVSPVAAVALGQIFRQELYMPAFDNASRFLMAVPIVLVIARKKINVFKLMEFAVPATIFATALSVLFHPNFKYTGSDVDRITTYFVDPLTFGSICLALALFSLVSIDSEKTDLLWVRLYKLSGFLIGLYMSFISGSRTGWLAIPIVLWIWLRVRKNIPHWVILALVSLFCVGAYALVPVVAIRIDLGVHQLLNYHWNGMNPDDPIESRIAFFRIGWFVFQHNPLGGWGDRGFKPLLDALELRRFAPESTRYLTYQAGFHNEIVTNMVRSGIWGMASSLSLFIMPIMLFARGLRSPSALVKNHALIGISYMICILVSAMSTEIFNLKFTAAFHAFMIACLTASTLVLMSSEKKADNL